MAHENVTQGGVKCPTTLTALVPWNLAFTAPYSTDAFSTWWAGKVH